MGKSKEIERLRQDCGELYQVISTLEAVCDVHALKAAGISGSDIIRALDNALAASEGKPRPHKSLLPWPKPTAEKNGRFVHRGNNKNKRSYWLPEGVFVGYQHRADRNTKIYFSIIEKAFFNTKIFFWI